VPLRSILLVGLLATLSFSGGHADTFTGNKLLDACRTKKAGFEEGYCFGYIVGSVQALRGAADTKGRICVPEDATNQQLTDIVVRRLDAKPEDRHRSALYVILASLVDAFPCQR
jgi:hypothetical protein